MRPDSSSTWQLLQGYDPSNTYEWNSTGAAAGTVYFGVWARDATSAGMNVNGCTAGMGCSDAYVSTSVTMTTPSSTTPSCPTPTISASPTTVVYGAGTHVTITAGVAGCTNWPLYEFWMRPASTPTWQLVQSYSTTATYDWNSTGAAAGTVYFSVWVKDVNSPTSYDAFAGTSVTVTTPSCPTPSISASPTTVLYGAGTHVDITGGVTGCSNWPLYEFWMRPASTPTWQLVQPYSTTATYDWNSTGADIGTVYFSVWVKDVNSSTPYDAFAGTSVEVVSPFPP